MKDIKHITLHQSIESEILNRPPFILVRIGTILICAILFGVFIISNYIVLPEMIDVNLKVDQRQVYVVRASNDGVLRCTLKGSFVMKGEQIAIIENLSTNQYSYLSAPFDGFLFSKYDEMLFAFSKGDTLLEIIPIVDNEVQLPFFTDKKFTHALSKIQKNNLVLIDNAKYDFVITDIKKYNNDSIKVYIKTSSKILDSFYRNGNEYSTEKMSIKIDEQSIWSRFIESFTGK